MNILPADCRQNKNKGRRKDSNLDTEWNISFIIITLDHKTFQLSGENEGTEEKKSAIFRVFQIKVVTVYCVFGTEKGTNQIVDVSCSVFWRTNSRGHGTKGQELPSTSFTCTARVI